MSRHTAKCNARNWDAKYSDPAWTAKFVVPELNSTRDRSRSPRPRPDPYVNDHEEVSDDEQVAEYTMQQLLFDFAGVSLLPRRVSADGRVRCPLCTGKNFFRSPAALEAHCAQTKKDDPEKHRRVLEFLIERKYFE